LLFEQDSPGHCGVDQPEPPAHRSRLGGMERQGPIGLPGLSEPQVVRHFTRLSQKNYAIDSGLYPLGSCTMKHNPRLNEKLARLPGFADLHPLAPVSTAQGALALISESASAPASSAAWAIGFRSLTFGISFGITGRRTRFFTAATTAAMELG